MDSLDHHSLIAHDSLGAIPPYQLACTRMHHLGLRAKEVVCKCPQLRRLDSLSECRRIQVPPSDACGQRCVRLCAPCICPRSTLSIVACTLQRPGLSAAPSRALLDGHRLLQWHSPEAAVSACGTHLQVQRSHTLAGGQSPLATIGTNCVAMCA